jgi:hypothetical protein
MPCTGAGSRGRMISEYGVGIECTLQRPHVTSGKRVKVERGSGHADQDAEAR